MFLELGEIIVRQPQLPSPLELDQRLALKARELIASSFLCVSVKVEPGLKVCSAWKTLELLLGYYKGQI